MKLLENLIGITETKIFMLDALIRLAKKQDGFIGIHDLEYMKSELISQSGKQEMSEALQLLEDSQVSQKEKSE